MYMKWDSDTYAFIQKLLLFLFAIAISFVVPLYAFHGRFEKSTELNCKILHLMGEHECVGLSVVVVRDNKIVYYGSFGYNPDYSDSTKRTPIKREDINYIASISKTFISAAIMQLKEKGLLKLDDDINKYLDFSVRNPYYPDVPITIRMLLTHRSSINKLNGSITFDHFNLIIPEKNKDYSKCYNKYKPGTAYDYSNYGYVILGAIIEKTTGMRLDDYIDKYIMKPMGLYGGFNIEKLDSNRFVRPYQYVKGKFVKPIDIYKPDKHLQDYILGFSTPALHPADGMIISSYDLAKFMLMHMNDGQYKKGKRIISRESEREMREVPAGNRNYGLALAHYNYIIDGVDLIGMIGGARGMHTAMYFNPKEKYGFVVFCNGCNSTSAADGGLNKLVVIELYKTFISR